MKGHWMMYVVYILLYWTRFCITFEVKIRPKGYWPARIHYHENIRNGYEYKCLHSENETEFEVCQYCQNISCFIYEQRNANLTQEEINASRYIMTCQEESNLPEVNEIHTFLDCVQIGNGSDYKLFIYEREYTQHGMTPIVNVIDPHFLKWVARRNETIRVLELGFRMRKVPEKFLAVNSKIIRNFTSICIDSRELKTTLRKKDLFYDYDDYKEDQMIIFSNSGLIKSRKPPDPPSKKQKWYTFYPSEVTLCELTENHVILDKICSIKVYNAIKPLDLIQSYSLKDDRLINYTIFEPFKSKSNYLQLKYYRNSQLYLLGLLFFSFISSISVFIWNNRKNYSICQKRDNRKKSYAQSNPQMYPAEIMKMYGPYMGQPGAPIPANFQQNDPNLLMMREQFYQR